MNIPKVSVIVPVYNAEDYLRQCLDSICGQTLKDIEIICVDDGSTDSSPDILKEYAGKDERVLILTEENKFAGAARNAGLEKARGETLSFLDCDDFFEPDMLEIAYNELQKYEADFVAFESDQYYMDKKEYVKNPFVVQRKAIPPYMPFKYRELTENVFDVFVGWAWDKLYRHSFVTEHGLRFQEQRTSNDLLFVYSALVLAKRISVVYKVLAHQRRMGSESLSVTREQSWYCFYDALTALRDRLIQEDIYWELEQDFINYALSFSLWNLKTLKEPTQSLLREKLKSEWFAELGITEKDKDYFYNQEDYDKYLELTG